MGQVGTKAVETKTKEVMESSTSSEHYFAAAKEEVEPKVKKVYVHEY